MYYLYTLEPKFEIYAIIFFPILSSRVLEVLLQTRLITATVVRTSYLYLLYSGPLYSIGNSRIAGIACIFIGYNVSLVPLHYLSTSNSFLYPYVVLNFFLAIVKYLRLHYTRFSPILVFCFLYSKILPVTKMRLNVCFNEMELFGLFAALTKDCSSYGRNEGQSARNRMFVRLGTDYEIRNGGYFETIKNGADHFVSNPSKIAPIVLVWWLSDG